MPVQAIPPGFNSVSTYLIVPNCVEALAFYQRAFSAEPGLRMAGPGNSTMHAEMRIGNSMIMMSDENPQWNMRAPNSLGGTPVSVHIYTQDADALFEQAVAAGCQPLGPMMDMFWGDRFGKLTDPYGHMWSIATHKEDVSPAEMEKRQAAFMAQMAAGEGCK